MGGSGGGVWARRAIPPTHPHFLSDINFFNSGIERLFIILLNALLHLLYLI